MTTGRSGRNLPQRYNEIEPGLAGHSIIGYDQIDLSLALEQFQGRIDIPPGNDPVIQVHQDLAVASDILRIIIHHKNGLGFFNTRTDSHKSVS